MLRGKEARELVGWDDISPWMKHAIVAIEDKRFYEHRGVDIRGIVRALWEDVRHKSAVQGGSTITQQFVKNAIVPNERTITASSRRRRSRGSSSQHWSKDRILTAYLNTIYFGNGAYGAQHAARRTSGTARRR